MKIALFITLIVLSTAPEIFAQLPEVTFMHYANKYEPGPDSRPQKGVPKGRMVEYFPQRSDSLRSKHIWWLYIPPGYDGKKPLPVMVFMDGFSFARQTDYRIPIVLNNLIAKKEIPMMAALFIDYAERITNDPDGYPAERATYRHSGWDDNYPAFLEKEIFPSVRKDVTLTSDPEGWAIVGGSASGSLAFNMAWARPDLFRKVVSIVGTMQFPFPRGISPVKGKKISSAEAVRQFEKKPLRVFLQSGENDPITPFAATKDLAFAMEEKGYDFTLVSGTAGHNGFQAVKIFPDIIRWLWRDYPR